MMMMRKLKQEIKGHGMDGINGVIIIMGFAIESNEIFMKK